ETAIGRLNAFFDESFRPATDAMEANASRDVLVDAFGALKTLAVSLTKISDDIRWMASGPRNGLGELRLPEVQPGSSIMPGKINPVIIESVLMVCAHVIGSDLSMTLGGLGSRFELNMMMPLMAHHFLQCSALLDASIRNLNRRCLEGLREDPDGCTRGVHRNLSLVTALVPVIGYDAAARISKIAFETGRTIRDVAGEETELEPGELDRLLDPRRMI
ncbi:MAG TPA: lyase family protein, partial [bacterium]|nr:lyase family protein [bacterium]